MKHFIEKAQESLRSIFEIILIIVTFLFPTIINVSGWIEVCFKNTNLDFDNIKYYFLMKTGNLTIGLLLTLFLLNKIREYNKEKIFNIKNVYHDYSYLWYWFCAKILGYKKCNLKLVPIYMQFKLGLNDTFDDYDVGLDDDYPIKENEQIIVQKENYNLVANEANLVLADTYPIVERQLPVSKRGLYTIKISRDQDDLSRHYSPEFIIKITNEVRQLPSGIDSINIYATTNPKHTLKITRDVFKLAERGNVKKLVVYQQNKDGIRKFEKKGIVIFNKL